MGQINVIHPAGRELKTVKGFKKLTCLQKEEEYLIQSPGVKRYCYRFGTLKNDMGFGAQTGDMVEAVVVYSMEPNRFQTGNKYLIEFREDA